MTSLSLSRAFDRARVERLADGLAAALAVSLPWSTSASGILAALWAIVLVPTLDWREARRVLLSAAGGLPVLLVLLGVAGMFWADVSWAERWGGIGSFVKLLAIPLFFVQYARSERGKDVFAAYLISCALVLLTSFARTIWPDLPHTAPHDGVMVKNGPTQSGEFAICIGGLLAVAHEALRRRDYRWLAVSAALALAMLGDIVFIATGRTALFIVLTLIAVYAVTRFNARGALIAAVVTGAFVVAAWFSSSYLRDRVDEIWTDAQAYEQSDARNSSGERIAFAKYSIAFIRSAPIIGHGTGSIHDLFVKATAGRTGASGSATTNPHNQTFAVGIQLGFVGIAVLWAMWLAHLWLFRGASFVAWIGLLLVVQNIVGSAFNSHLFDFVQGWTYVVGVGVAGGMVLRDRRRKAA
ncbi:MAG TPA: O-antigen ligase family protein [Pseudolabrys sp.]|nr:O-antigen ligase family protein [Pseudolabrys sp.]